MIQEPFRGIGLEAHHAAYGLFYNTKAVKRDELPKTWDQLADPKWSGQFANDPAGSAFSLLGGALTDQQIFEIVGKIKANRPIVTQAASDTVQRVVAQQVLFGLGPVDSAEAEKLRGAPIDWVFLDPTGAAQTAFFPTPNPPHPNAARLFTAWLATEGLPLFEEFEGRAQIRPGSGTKMARAVEAANIKISMATTAEEMASEAALRAQVAKLLSQ
jgi:ABC-type Fe3+ transport system substrate-binding protein